MLRLWRAFVISLMTRGACATQYQALKPWRSEKVFLKPAQDAVFERA